MIPIVMLFFGMLVLMILGIPLAFSILGISTVVFLVFTDIPFWQIAQRFFSGIDSFVLTAIPFFLLAGNLMNTGKITDKLMNLSSSMVGHIRGGLAHINVLVSFLFGGISGSAVADTSGIGTILIPAMIKKGYSPEFTVSVTATSSVLGQIVPPSLIMIIYAATANTSVQAMFLAGIIPGILLALTMMIVSYVYAIKYDYPREERTTFKQFLHVFRDSLSTLVMPLLIIGGVLFGIFTATESAVIAVVYSLIITMLVDKTIDLPKLKEVLIVTAKSSATSLFCIGTASVFGYLMAYFRVNKLVGDLMLAMNLSANTYILFVVFTLFHSRLVYGCGTCNLYFCSNRNPTRLNARVTSCSFGNNHLSNLGFWFGHPSLWIVPSSFLPNCRNQYTTRDEGSCCDARCHLCNVAFYYLLPRYYYEFASIVGCEVCIIRELSNKGWHDDISR